ncbi:DUF1194 domain-containing protein [Acuticoccus mangrovi]|uniref:DUF1194 domain-containing protein n=1 Tax=Acuticoccus mangrovi TaxID=2796142 RepID=A0A934ITC1_9HYPH|nr:DUF1194 domain-containing protein [Acuticoccus mangrovi]MBJ3777309.1 DUF1194 domain-containing protein [Acuticoccus mangrovi]
MLRTIALAVSLVAASATARATPPVVDVELILAVDVSWSMDLDEQRLQRQGYVDAIRHPDVIAAIRKGDWGRIAVTYVEWAGVGLERTLVPWTIIEDDASANAFANQLEEAPIGRMRRTSISSILIHSATLFDNGIDSFRRVVDVSGDGPNNMGTLVTDARDLVLRQGITINGLPIMIKTNRSAGYFHLESLDKYYEDCVIGGFGAFMITVNDKKRLQEAIRRKLILEIAAIQPRVIPAGYASRSDPHVIPAGYSSHSDRPRVDCAVGEKQWNRWRRLDRW